MKKIPTNSFKIMRIVFIISIVIGLVPIVIWLSASIAALFNYGFTTFIYGLIATIVFLIFIILPLFIMKGLCETGISFSDHISKQTKILEEINKKLDNKEMQENYRQTKICEETDKKSDNEETQE